MSLFLNRTANLVTAEQLLAERTSKRSSRWLSPVGRSQALHHSAVWACLRLRADLISTMPVDVFRRVGGVQVEQTKPPVLITPGGKSVSWVEWCYSTQFDLDSVGNTVGVITARDGMGLPSVIELANIDDVSFVGKGPTLTGIKIGSTTYDPSEIWHEKQYTLAGCPIGLSPVAHAAMSIRGYLSAQEFAADWFENSTVPGGHLKNTARTLNRKEALKAKDSFKAAVGSGDVWVSGNDWEYEMLSAKASESAFLESMNFSVNDVCRFFGVPADMIDAASGGSSITYANITQRNLQLLIMNIGPALARREDAISRGLLPQPRYVKFNRASLLQMDVKTRYDAHGVAIDKRFKAPSEVREDENLPPFTPEQEAEFARLFGGKTTTPAAGSDPAAASSSAPVLVEARSEVAPPPAPTHLHSHVNLSVPVQVDPADIRVEVPPAEVRIEPGPAPVVNVSVEPTPVTVEVTNEVDPTPITVDVPPPLIEVRNDVQPAEVTVVPTEASTRRIERDPTTGEIVAVHLE